MTEIRMPPEESVTTSVRWPAALRDQLKAAADRRDRSVNNLLIVIVKEWLAEHGEDE